MEAAKHWRRLCEAGVPAELRVNGGLVPTDEQTESVYQALEKLNDELPKVVIFKHEDDRCGVAEGPVTVGPDPHLVILPGAAALLGPPWRPPCTCEQSGDEPGETCSECGGEVPEPWMTLPEAEDKARSLGLELRET